MGDNDIICNTELSLRIGSGISLPKSSQEKSKNNLSLNLSFRSGASGVRMAGDTNKRSSSTNDQDENDDNGEGDDRSNKKLRFSKEQMSVLESKFNKQSKISNEEKNDLAKRLGITPRQVEVWFQNRRSRTKVNQMEIDCARWKKLYEQMIEEKKEIQELRRSLDYYRRQHFLR